MPSRANNNNDNDDTVMFHLSFDTSSLGTQEESDEEARNNGKEVILSHV